MQLRILFAADELARLAGVSIERRLLEAQEHREQRVRMVGGASALERIDFDARELARLRGSAAELAFGAVGYRHEQERLAQAQDALLGFSSIVASARSASLLDLPDALDVSRS